MICETCRHLYSPYRGYIECSLGEDPFYDMDQEQEACDSFQRRITKEEIEEVRAEEKLAYRRDNGLL